MRTPIVIATAATLSTAILYQMFSHDEPAPSVPAVVEPPVSTTFDPNADLGAESDQTVDTLRTLTKKVEQGNKGYEDLQQQLAAQNATIANLQSELKKQGAESAGTSPEITDQINEKLESVKATLEHQIRSLQRNAGMDVAQEPEAVNYAEDEPLLMLPGQYPQELKVRPGKNSPATQRDKFEQKIWVEPIDAITETGPNGVPSTRYPDLNKKVDGNSLEATKSTAGGSREVQVHEQAPKPPKVPVYTIPANSTLLDAVAMTSVIGRIPLDGKVESPYRFKALIGADNLATNGLKIKGLDNVVVSGVAIGDFTLRCTRGDIDSMTFTFTDGRIRTLSGADGGQEGKLGYISDPYGVPCIPGAYISNLTDYMANVGGMKFLATAADAISESQMATIDSGGGIANGGTSTQVLSGDMGLYAGGKGLKEGVGTMEDYLNARQKSAFDAVFVEAGTQLAIHVSTQLEIDYDPAGRLLDYTTEKGGVYATALD